MANVVGNAIKEEMRRAGAPPPKKEPAEYESDEMLFKAHVLDPQDPTYIEEQTWENPALPMNDPNRKVKFLTKRGQLVSTMALGNFTSREVRGINSLMNISRICDRNGYHEIAANCYMAYVHHVVASQCVEFKLGTMLLTNLNALYRREELPPQELDAGEEKKGGGGLGAFIDKIKSIDKANKPDEAKRMM